MLLDFTTLDKWIPYKLLDDGNETVCKWLYTGNRRFRETFFDYTLNECKRLPENTDGQKNVTSIYQLLDWAKEINVEEPAAIIFHISRCGSTIVSQALANNINHIVLSEVPFFDDVLRMPFNNELQRIAFLKAAIKLYSLHRNGYGNKVFIKTDSWHIMFYKEFREMYPSVPFILLYRNPGEVVRSLNKQAGMHCIPQFIEPVFFGIKEQVVTAADFYDYPIKVIEKYLEAFINITVNDNNAFLFNYNDGMLQVMEDICKIIGIAFTEDDRVQMKQRLMYHSKSGGTYIPGDPETQSPAEKFSHVYDLYNRLEEIRRAKK